jgi:mono/diheme cytochrome c family protein
MTPRLIFRGCVAVLLALLCAGTMEQGRTPALSDAILVGVEAQGPDVGTEAQRESGKAIYLKNCAQCHGEKGDGAGYATPHLSPRPRDFTSAKFKVRTTPNGTLPTHQDLVNIIRRGMPYTSMPAWPDLSDQEPRAGSQACGASERAELDE